MLARAVFAQVISRDEEIEGDLKSPLRHVDTVSLV